MFPFHDVISHITLKTAITHLVVWVRVCFSLNRSYIHIRNMLTRLLGRSNCWSGGLRVWGGGQLIAGDYKPQSGGSVSGFDQKMPKVPSQLSHTHTNTQISVCVCVNHLQANITLLSCCWCEPNLTPGTTHIHTQFHIVQWFLTCMRTFMATQNRPTRQKN